MPEHPHEILVLAINLDRAPERWRRLEAQLALLPWRRERIAAVDGRRLEFPHPGFDEDGYVRRQGRRRIPAEVGCHLSHRAALQRLLDDPTATHALLLEDDAVLPDDLPALLEAALRASARWNLLRLSTVNHPVSLPVSPLPGGRTLAVGLTRDKGAGAYLVDRTAAAALLRNLAPMRLPYDHAFDLEWLHGFRAMRVQPSPIGQFGFPTQIQTGVQENKLPAWRRYWTVFPYRTVLELQRVSFRLARWIRERFRRAA